MTKHTPGPWKLILHGNEKYPFPLSVHTVDGEYWIARDGEVSSEANARLIAAAPETAAERDHLRALNAELVEALQNNLALVELKFGNTNESANAAIAQASAVLEKCK